MSSVVSLIYLGTSFQKMTHHFLPHGSLRPTNLEKNLKPCLTGLMPFNIGQQVYINNEIEGKIFFIPHNCLNERVLLSTHNIYFGSDIYKCKTI